LVEYLNTYSVSATSTFAGHVQTKTLTVDNGASSATSTLTIGDAGRSLRGCINMVYQNGATYATSSFYIGSAGTSLVVESNACK